MTDSIQSFSFHSDLLRALLWQYEEAENLKALARHKLDWFERATVSFWQNWYNDVFNIDTATDFGLGIWARIWMCRSGWIFRRMIKQKSVPVLVIKGQFQGEFPA